MVEVRLAQADDVENLAVLCQEMNRFYGEQTDATLEQVAADIRAALFGDPPWSRALIAVDFEGTIVGFAAMSWLWPAAWPTRSMYLKELYVAEAARKTGVGTALMAALTDLAAAEGCTRVEWTTDRDNTAARAFYARLGAAELA